MGEIMETNKLNKTIAKFWKSKGRNSIYYLGRCADFVWALRKFLGGGTIYVIGPGHPIIWHVVLKYNGYYWDVRGKQTIRDVMNKNTMALSEDNIRPAGSKEKAHIKKLLSNKFVNDTVKGLKEASK